MTPSPRRGAVVVVGSGTFFLSGISYYTHRLVIALAREERVAAILVRRSVPERFYPGRRRAGAQITDLAYPAEIEVVDDLDWSGGAGLARAIRLIVAERPDAMVFQWWTGAILHLYVLLTVIARILGSAVIVEFHESQDTGEARLPGVSAYVTWIGRLWMRLADGFVVHADTEQDAVRGRFALGERPVVSIPHGPFDQYRGIAPERVAPEGVVNILFFGTIRPYKGLEDLIAAFDLLTIGEAEQFWLTVVGETWEGWTGPIEMIGRSPHRDRITLVNRYVSDEEAGGFIAGADAMALPYRRSAASGPLHVAMASGLPVIVTAVGGLPQAADGYAGAVFVPAQDPQEIRRAFDAVRPLVGTVFSDPQSWDATATRYAELLERVRGLRRGEKCSAGR